ncbi:signal peptidase I, partial [mine drainage metagenome]
MQHREERGGLMARPGARKALRETVETIIVAVVLALVIRTWVVEPFVVEGFSMENTLHNGERLLVNKFWWHVSPLSYGDIIVFLPPIPGETQDFVKRVIATGGQTVSMQSGQVYVNGHRMPQPYLVHNGVSTKDHWTMAPIRVPKG